HGPIRIDGLDAEPPLKQDDDLAPRPATEVKRVTASEFSVARLRFGGPATQRKPTQQQLARGEPRRSIEVVREALRRKRGRQRRSPRMVGSRWVRRKHAESLPWVKVREHSGRSGRCHRYRDLPEPNPLKQPNFA
ncbi:MAG: hypothetical protein RL354_2135, partial [Planctomycetota bacterium]